MYLEFSTGFLCVASLFWLLDTQGLLSALLPALLAHELGHALCIRLCGGRLVRLRFEACGLRMDYRGTLLPFEELLCALTGPGAGLFYALAAACGGYYADSDYLRCSAGLSLLLSLFNLLPAPMLDGGRALALLGWRHARLSGCMAGALLLGGGLVFLHSAYGPAALLAGFWVLLGTCQAAKKGI
ncbi:MAG: hypothetical protein IKK00_07220 [Oscillospiraceae bacterium]|nr:hypothetical protein [Oscillospiraceae bacterium]MBR6561845.1 hypothetical protein [Oscillospiraceae bacterium]